MQKFHTKKKTNGKKRKRRRSDDETSRNFTTTCSFLLLLPPVSSLISVPGNTEIPSISLAFSINARFVIILLSVLVINNTHQYQYHKQLFFFLKGRETVKLSHFKSIFSNSKDFSKPKKKFWIFQRRITISTLFVARHTDQKNAFLFAFLKIEFAQFDLKSSESESIL